MKEKHFNPVQILIEIVVVTIGILLAFQLNQWKDDRKEKQTERRLLREIQSNLQLDLIDLKDNQSGHLTSLQYIDSLKAISSIEPYQEKIPTYLHGVFRDYLFLPQTSAFESLKSKGVDLISNDSLRIKILRLYDFHYPLLVQIEKDYEPSQFTKFYIYVVDNYFLNFDLSDPLAIEPLIRSSTWLRNPDVLTKIDLAKSEHSFNSEIYKRVMKQVEELINDIDNELNH
jgi:hypothetical protein